MAGFRAPQGPADMILAWPRATEAATGLSRWQDPDSWPSCLMPDPGRDLQNRTWRGRRITYWICEGKDVTAIVFERNAKQGEAEWFMSATKLRKTDLKHNSCIREQTK